MDPGETTLAVRVSKKWIEATDICGYELVSATGGELPSFTAGSHVDVYLPGELIRQYSLCNSPDERHRYTLGVLRNAASKGGSKAFHDLVNVGDILRISKPKNLFPLARGARKSLLFAGGIGVTPILSMAEQLASEGAQFELHYCARSKERAAFLARLAESSFSDNVHFHFDDGPSSQMLDLEGQLCNPEEGAHIYVCGPKGFMDSTLAQARNAGWLEQQLHCELFENEVAFQPGDESFQVRIASSGQTIIIPPDQKVTKVLADNGIDIPTSCSQGLCGTCVTGVLEGEPDHRDVYLTPEERQENKKFLPCCSRAKSKYLVLDL